ncbi:hypothetical protein NA56DRAFT_276243 [Hyaloscypha hepaticicola]|uniref:Nephrocystin 3-like N-terminal domain-containing protein n=1 Tax=Hyaloscypha hepaticicola TaxID=2082293 RepID=A0A2J6PTF4_9HELO|nr:hypothetical protein NA56DRAFT_276243 [Hyaloscypha hepaticicola]
MNGHWQKDEPKHIVNELSEEHWTDFEMRVDSCPAIFCGICVLGIIHAASKDHLLDQHSLSSLQKLNGSRQKIGSSCRSTRTLISKNSESLKGTGRWFLDHEWYNQWLSQPSSFLWLYGRPGAGKSVLMSTVVRDIEKTRRAGELVVYYFANGYYHGVSTAKAILCSMLGQLLVRKPVQKSFREILPLLNDLIAVGNPMSSTSMICLFSKIRHTLRAHETLYLLLDGLDEETYGPQDRELVLELLDHASRHDPNHQIKCFVSSRSTFFGDRLPKGAMRVDLDCTTLTRQDMSLYVQDSLHKSVHIFHEDFNPRELEEQLLNCASGSFLVLRLILEQGQYCPGQSKANFEDYLVNLNDFGAIGLGKIYGSMLARIEDCNKEAVLSMLRWVTFAARPLEAKELLVLHKQRGVEIKEEDIANISAGLLISSGNQIRFTHLSVREYFESQLSDKWEELSDEANEIIAHACLKLLPTENILQSLKLPTNNDPSTANSPVSGFVPYAETHWIIHYKRGERRSIYLAGLLHEILEQGLKFSKTNGHPEEEAPKENIPGSFHGVGYRQPSFPSDNFGSLNIVNIILEICAQFGFPKLAKLQLDMGANPNAPSRLHQETPLCMAAKWGHLEVAKLLLQRGADPFLTSASGLTPMAYAMANGHYEIQDLLMLFVSTDSRISNSKGELGGLQNIRDDKGKTLPPIMLSGETVPESERQLFTNSSDTQKASRFSTAVNWYPGVHMYRVLQSSSKRGIDEVKRLLIAAGNDKGSLDMVISISHRGARTGLSRDMGWVCLTRSAPAHANKPRACVRARTTRTQSQILKKGTQNGIRLRIQAF